MTDPRTVVASAVQSLAARRLGRAFLPLAVTALAGIGGGVAGVWSAPVATTLAVGAAAVAGAFMVMGLRAVRVALETRPGGAWRWAGLARVVPFAWSIWALVVPGVGTGRAALARGAWGGVALAVLTMGLVLRVLLDAHRVGELEALAGTMAVPAPEEEASP